jgi:hypothetical protein
MNVPLRGSSLLRWLLGPSMAASQLRRAIIAFSCILVLGITKSIVATVIYFIVGLIGHSYLAGKLRAKLYPRHYDYRD